ncbi:hypothetical protein BOSEA31B_20510 [Hyphomicrobiales bacterium]|nr:hypothetical protein BOSEA31B_20510 [Hyphomicrobiales bacterium]CAH1702998.1 hypothetical protein BOSEA1005_30870 [Hyphomicrobiales bacterium]
MRSLTSRSAEKVTLRRIFDNFALVHKNYAVCYLLRKPHFVRDNHHGHPFLREFDHNVEHFVDHLRIEC